MKVRCGINTGVKKSPWKLPAKRMRKTRINFRVRLDISINFRQHRNIRKRSNWLNHFRKNRYKTFALFVCWAGHTPETSSMNRLWMNSGKRRCCLMPNCIGEISSEVINMHKSCPRWKMNLKSLRPRIVPRRLCKSQRITGNWHGTSRR